MVLHSQSQIKALVCHYVEKTKEEHKEKGFKTVYLSVKDNITDKIGKTEKLEQKSNTMYIVIAILAVIILITFLILMAMACRSNKVVTQQQNTIVRCNTSNKKSNVIITDETYSNPADVYYTDTAPVSSNYSDPYVALYTAPIPKKNRKKLTTNEYCNTGKRNIYENVTDRKRTNQKESIPYENLKEEFNSNYVNLNEKNYKTYDNFNDTGSDLYYAVVDK
ncbi:uncharacterized protein LOC123668279 [Melitaea cinxia]|uniref:uncharacterized protein LOC123668279 n=1 Tax=Melitaea cinxia TaxID=113334 RepID=UPI001E273B97|nr:uncharacterized protein LOC123668279 [Melitaea cinxia]